MGDMHKLDTLKAVFASGLETFNFKGLTVTLVDFSATDRQLVKA